MTFRAPEAFRASLDARIRTTALARGVPISRVRQVTGAFSAAEIRAALHATFVFRKTHAIPTALPAPPDSWRPSYARMAAADQLAWPDLDTLLLAVRAFLDPVLVGQGGTWSSESWAWE